MSMLKRFYGKLRNLLCESYIKLGIFVFLIALLTFGLGYLVGRDFSPAPIIIEQNNEL